jgi:hypothetical protein
MAFLISSIFATYTGFYIYHKILVGLGEKSHSMLYPNDGGGYGN